MSKKLNTVFIEHSNHQYQMLFIKMGFTVVNYPEEAAIICFTGGSDVSPHMYHDKAHPYTASNAYRDAKEERLFLDSKAKGKPCVGICRGAQFLNVMSGGRMFQHVEKHTAPHYITDHETGEVVYVSSTHHQMMMPGPGAQVIATSNLKGKREWYDGEVARRDVSDEDYEVMYYPDSNSLCFQPHPEFTGEDMEPMFHYFRSLLTRFIGA